MRSKLLALAALTFGVAAPAAAQLEIAAFAGTMVPLRSMVIDTAGGGYFKMATHSVYGLRIAKTMSPSLGLEFQFGTGTGNLDIVSGGTPLNLPANVYFADARARVRLIGTGDVSLHGIGGVGYTKYGTGLFEAAHEIDSSTELKGVITGVVGLGFRAKVSDRLTLTVDATDRIHEQMVDAASLSGLIEKTQHDATVMAGFSFPL